MALSYLRGYAPDTVAQVAKLFAEQRSGAWLLQRHPQGHGLRTDRALFQYVQDLRQEYLRGADAVSKVCFDNKLHGVKNALAACRTFGIEAKFGPSEDSFRRICRPIAELLDKKTVKNGPLRSNCSRCFRKSDRLLGWHAPPWGAVNDGERGGT